MKQQKQISKLFIILVLPIFLVSCAAKKDLAALKVDYQKQQSSLISFKEQQNDIKSELTALKEENEKLKAENDKLQKQLKAARLSIKEISEQELESQEKYKKGLVFKVQIGAYVKREIPDNLTTSENLETEEKGDMQRIIVGQFRDYKKAESLKNQLRAMGVGDAFIVPYVDDVRKTLEEVL